MKLIGKDSIPLEHAILGVVVIVFPLAAVAFVLGAIFWMFQ